MKKQLFLITEGEDTYQMEFITDREVEWTTTQYMRNRMDCTMELISEEETDETEPTSRKIEE